MRNGALFTVLAAAALGAGCVGEIGGSDDKPEGPDATAQSCGALEAGRSPLRRLSKVEYRATVRDLLDIEPPALDDFVDDEVHGGFDRNVTAPSELAVERYRVAAASLAAQARERLADLVTCDHAETACAEAWLADFGMRVLRRPLEADELAALVSLYEAERAASDADSALELAVQALFMSPAFLYHVEIGTQGDTQALLLTGYETASRLSYFLWGTMPDDALFAAAADGSLETREGIEAEARRMLEDPKAREMMREFQRQWLDLRRIDDFARDAETFPEWDPALLVSMQKETETFFEQVIFEGDGRLETLLSAPYSYLDPALAAHYGVEAVGDGEFEKTELPVDERAGILTQGLFLAMHAYPSENSWVHRGKFIRERLLCATMPPPPPEVDLTNTNDPNRLTNSECSGCHLLMDPIGQAFDRYDAVGQYAVEDAEGDVIAQSGEVFGSPIGSFDSITSLAGELAADAEVHACIAKTFASYATGRSVNGETCSNDAVIEAFDASGHDIRELIVAITVSDGFRYTSAD